MVGAFGELHDGYQVAKRGTDQIHSGGEVFAGLGNDKQSFRGFSFFRRTTQNRQHSSNYGRFFP